LKRVNSKHTFEIRIVREGFKTIVIEVTEGGYVAVVKKVIELEKKYAGADIQKYRLRMRGEPKELRIE
jgi:ribosomal protein S17